MAIANILLAPSNGYYSYYYNPQAPAITSVSMALNDPAQPDSIRYYMSPYLNGTGAFYEEQSGAAPAWGGWDTRSGNVGGWEGHPDSFTLYELKFSVISQSVAGTASVSNTAWAKCDYETARWVQLTSPHGQARPHNAVFQVEVRALTQMKHAVFNVTLTAV